MGGSRVEVAWLGRFVRMANRMFSGALRGVEADFRALRAMPGTCWRRWLRWLAAELLGPPGARHGRALVEGT